MAAYTIDTLATARKLQAAGFESSQAEAVAEAVAHQGEQLATKADITGVQREIAGLRWMFGLHFAFTLAMLGIMAALTWQVFTIGQEVAGIMAILTAG